MAPIRGFEARQARVWRCRRLWEQIARQRAGDKGPAASCPGEGAQARAVCGCWPGLGAAAAPRPPRPPCPGAHPHPGWHGRGAVGYQVAQCWHWSHATPPTVPGTALGMGLCCGPSLALHPQRCPSRGAVGLGWGAVGHRAMGRSRERGRGHNRGWQMPGRSSQSHCVSVSPAAIGVLVKAPYPVSAPRSLSPRPGQGRLRHSPPQAAFVPAPRSWLQTHRPGGSCPLCHSTGPGTPPVPPGAAGAVPTRGVPGGLWGTMPNGVRPPRGRDGTWPQPSSTQAVGISTGSPSLPTGMGGRGQQGGRGLEQTPSIALNMMGTPRAQAGDKATELLPPGDPAELAGRRARSRPSPSTASRPPKPLWFWGCWQEGLSRGARPAHTGHCRLQ